VQQWRRKERGTAPQRNQRRDLGGLGGLVDDQQLTAPHTPTLRGQSVSLVRAQRQGQGASAIPSLWPG
jgi:hypothetical protein